MFLPQDLCTVLVALLGSLILQIFWLLRGNATSSRETFLPIHLKVCLYLHDPVWPAARARTACSGKQDGGLAGKKRGHKAELLEGVIAEETRRRRGIHIVVAISLIFGKIALHT
ncbi:uncharacterized protein LOC144616183 [Panthera onca]